MAIEVTLPAALERFVKSRVADGVYASEQEVIADAVRRLAGGEFDEAETAYLRQAYLEGVNSHSAGDWNAEEIWQDVKAMLAAKAQKAA
jgi:putative addiction module CopG family antidote